MKKRVVLLLFILSTYIVFSQNCEETRSEVLNGEIYDYQLENCTTDVTINTLDENTSLHGITLIDAIESINLKPTENNRISIVPDDPLDFIDLLITDTYTSVEDYLGAKELRSSGGTSETESKDVDPERVMIYPNPVDTILTIENGGDILYYKIVDVYGLTLKEGTITSNLQLLELSSLTEGIYYLLMQMEDEIEIITLYKN